MLRMIRRLPVLLVKLARLPWRERFLLAEAAMRLVVAWIALRIVPFRRLARHFGEAKAETPTVGPEDPDLTFRVAWAVRIASRYVPWPTKCLADAIAAQAMLRRREQPTTLYLGVAKDGEEFGAHAWLRCGTEIITGDDIATYHTVLTSFADTPGATGSALRRK